MQTEFPLSPAPMLLPTLALVATVAAASYVHSNWSPMSALAYSFWLQKRARRILGAPFGGAGLPSRGLVRDERSVMDGCELVSATAYYDGRKQACGTFEAAQRHAQLGRRVLVVYRPVEPPTLGGGDPEPDAPVFQMTYNPHRRALEGPLPARFPPHTDEWGVMDGARTGGFGGCSPGDRILSAMLTTHRPDGSATTHDVTDALRRAFGPLGDFHARAGALVTAFSLVPDLDGDVIAASLLYYDDEGEEHTLVLPYLPVDDRADGPEWSNPVRSETGDRHVFASEPQGKKVAEPPYAPARPATGTDPAVRSALAAAVEAREQKENKRTRKFRRGSSRKKSCALQ